MSPLEGIRLRAKIQIDSLVRSAREANHQLVSLQPWLKKSPDNPHFLAERKELLAKRYQEMLAARNVFWVVMGRRTKTEQRKWDQMDARIEARRKAREGQGQ